MTTRVYGRAEGERPALRAAIRETVIARLRPDLERLRDHLGGDFHCWGLLDPSQDRPAAVARSSTPRRTTSGVDAFPDRFEVRGRVPDGFRLLPDYVSPGEQEAIWAWIHDPANLSFKRRVTGVAAQEVLAEVEGFPAWASRLAGRMHAQGIVSLVPDNLHFMRYESGEGIGAHVNPRYLGTFVAVLNLGSTRVFELENDAERSAVRVLLRPGDVYLISGEALRSWVHGVPATRVDDFKGRRYQRQAAVSVQWRHIADRAPFEGENVATWRRELDHAAAPARSWG